MFGSWVRLSGIVFALLLLGSACSATELAEPEVGTIPPRPVGDEFKLPPIASGGTAATDFEELYRDLDALRSESIRTEDPAILGKVSSNLQEIADLQAEADDASTIWDQSNLERTVSDVAVFSVVDENNVLLRINDNVRGAAVKRNLDGVVLEEAEVREQPDRTYIVWLEREMSGPWFLAAEYWVAGSFPSTPDDFEVGPKKVTADGTATMLFHNFRRGTCLLVSYPNTVPRPVCLYPGVSETGGARSRVRYSLDRSEAYEMIMMVSDGPLRHGIAVDGAEPVEFETVIADDRKVGFWVGAVGQQDEALIVPLDPVAQNSDDQNSNDDVVKVDLERKRADARSSFAGDS